MKKLIVMFFVASLVATIFTSCETLEVEQPGLLVPLTVGEDPSLPSISVNGAQLHAETFGNPGNPIIVVLHGGPGGDNRALLNCSKFSDDGYFVVFYDQRGSGLSKRYSKNVYTIQLFVDDLDAVIQHYRQSPGQKVILMGHSWGAMLATAYVNQKPGNIQGVVLIEPGGFTWHDTEESIKRSRSLAWFGESINDYMYLDQLITGNDHNTLDYKAALKNAADFSKGNKMGIPGPYPMWRSGAICNIAAIEFAKERGFDFTTNLQQFTRNVLFVYSGKNEAYGRLHAEHVSSAYPNVNLAEVSSTGHEVPYFGWNEYYPIAKSYLNSIQ